MSSDQFQRYAPPVQHVEHTVTLVPELMVLIRQIFPAQHQDAVLAAVADGVKTIVARIDLMSGSVDTAIADLTTRVQADTDATNSATTMINGFAAQLAAAVAAAQAQGATPAQLQSFTDLGTSIQTNADKLSAAVVANTPAATP